MILPSIEQEDFPNVILEAMSLGKPVISTKIAGIPEQIDDNKTGVLVEPRDEWQLMLALNKLIVNKEMRLQMGKSGRDKFQKCFTSAVTISKYLFMYDKLFR